MTNISEVAPTEQLTVFTNGLGKAGMNLHGNVWNGLSGYDITRIGYDADPARREAARDAGLIVIENLLELPDALPERTLHVVDNTTSSGQHAQSTRATLDVLSSAGIAPRAWLLEKPVVSSDDERVVMDAALEEIGGNVFVNENYLASQAVTRGRQIISEEEAAGNPAKKILIHFVKDRVPNVVLDNRFTDIKGLAVYGIEMPHQLAIASVLSGGELDTRSRADGGSIVSNTFYHDIDGIEASEGNVTVFEQDGKTITLRQGLGPFDFDAENIMKRRAFDWRTNEADRFALITFADGKSLKLTFDPVQGAPRYHSQIELMDAEGTIVENEVVEDNTLRNLIGAVAAFAASDGRVRPALLDQLKPADAMRYFEQLRELRATAGDPISVQAIAGNETFSVGAYLDQLAQEKAARQKL